VAEKQGRQLGQEEGGQRLRLLGQLELGGQGEGGHHGRGHGQHRDQRHGRQRSPVGSRQVLRQEEVVGRHRAHGHPCHGQRRGRDLGSLPLGPSSLGQDHRRQGGLGKGRGLQVEEKQETTQ
jgi:hypothetical protein